MAGVALLREDCVGYAKLVVDKATDTVVGATFVGSGIAELVHAATVANVGCVPTSKLWHAVPSYPTVSQGWLRMLEALRTQRRATEDQRDPHRAGDRLSWDPGQRGHTPFDAHACMMRLLCRRGDVSADTPRASAPRRDRRGRAADDVARAGRANQQVISLRPARHGDDRSEAPGRRDLVTPGHASPCRRGVSPTTARGVRRRGSRSRPRCRRWRSPRRSGALVRSPTARRCVGAPGCRPGTGPAARLRRCGR